MPIPTPALYSLEQVAERLGLQVRTVRHYVRSGRLKAVRIGKQYRVTRESLESLTGGGAVIASASVMRQRLIEVSSVVQIDAMSPAMATRVTNLLIGAASSPKEEAAPRIETIYDAERGRMKVILIGDLHGSADVFKLIAAITDA
jgi:excisionase family DNA binding protein